MAIFKINYIHTMWRQYLLQVFNKTKPYSSIRQCVICLKSKPKQNFTVCLPVNGFKHREISKVFYSKSVKSQPVNLDSLVDYEKVSEETLQSLYDRFEEILQYSAFEDWDVNYSNGVLTITLEEKNVYVINKQTPNRQIWLSSPISGPKRYDFMNGTWVYKHDGYALHQLLTDELSQLLQKEANFSTCNYSS